MEQVSVRWVGIYSNEAGGGGSIAVMRRVTEAMEETSGPDLDGSRPRSSEWEDRKLQHGDIAVRRRKGCDTDEIHILVNSYDTDYLVEQITTLLSDPEQ